MTHDDRPINRQQQLYREVLELAERLAKQQGRELADVWEEVLSLQRERYARRSDEQEPRPR